MDDPRHFLAETAWLRRLAGELVADGTQGDDLVQDAQLAALRHPPDRDVRGWLARVAGNLSRKRVRSDARRRRREQAAARPESIDSAAEIVVRFEQQGRVVAAMETLAEPYRVVILMRYWDGLPPREIARQLGLPVETVRTRQKRALAMLRARLDEDCGGRAAWLAALGGLAEIEAVGGGTGFWPGVMWMSAKSKVGTLVAVVVVVAVSIWAFADPPGSAIEGRASTVGTTRSGPGAGGTGAEVAVGSDAKDWVRAPVGPTTCTLDVELRWQSDGEPAIGVGVALVPERRNGLFTDTSRGVSDADGRVHFADLSAGRVELATDRQVTKPVRVVAGKANRITVELPRGADVEGRVVDERGEPVPGAAIWFGEKMPGATGQIVTRADAQGRFEIRDVPSLRYVAARMDGYAPSKAQPCFERARVRLGVTAPSDGTVAVELVLRDAGARVEGRVLGPSGQPVRGAGVRLGTRFGFRPPVRGSVLQDWPPPVRLTTDERGVFRAAGLPRGRVVLLVRATGLAPHCEYWELSAATEPITIQLGAGASLAGRVTDADGRPIAGARVAVTGHASDYSASTESAADGSFRLEGLEAERVQAKVSAAGFARQRISLASRAGAELSWHPVLRPVLLVRGRLLDPAGKALEGWVVALDGGTKAARSKRTDCDGRFTCTQLEDVDYEVALFRPGQRILDFFERCGSPRVVRPGTGEIVVRAGVAPLGAFVHGHLMDPAGVPFAGAGVTVLQLRRGGGIRIQRPAKQPTAVGTGYFRVGPLPPGRYRLLLNAWPSEHGPLPVEPFDIEAGEQRDLGELRVPAAGRLQVSITKGFTREARPSVQVYDATGETAWLKPMETAGAGCPLVPGKYRLTVFGKGFLWIRRRFEIQAGKTAAFTFELEPGVQRKLVFPLPEPDWWKNVNSVRAEVESVDGRIRAELHESLREVWPVRWWPSLAVGRFRLRVIPDKGPTLQGEFVVRDLKPRLSPIRVRMR